MRPNLACEKPQLASRPLQAHLSVMVTRNVGHHVLMLCSLALATGACARTSAFSSRQSEGPARGRVAWDSPRRIASGLAIRGAWRMNESDYRWVDDPSVEVVADDALVVWADQTRK